MQNLWATCENWLDIIHVAGSNITLHVAVVCLIWSFQRYILGYCLCFWHKPARNISSQISSSRSELGFEHVDTVRKDLIGILHSQTVQEIHLWLGNWWHIQLLLPTRNFESQGVRVHLLNSLCNSQSRSHEIISELHTQCQQIPRSCGSKHHKFDWGLCHVNNQTQRWGTLDKYMICCFKSTAVLFFQPTKCISNSWTTYGAVLTWHWWESAASLLF